MGVGVGVGAWVYGSEAGAGSPSTHPAPQHRLPGACNGLPAVTRTAPGRSSTPTNRSGHATHTSRTHAFSPAWGSGPPQRHLLRPRPASFVAVSCRKYLLYLPHLLDGHHPALSGGGASTCTPSAPWAARLFSTLDCEGLAPTCVRFLTHVCWCCGRASGTPSE